MKRPFQWVFTSILVVYMSGRVGIGRPGDVDDVVEMNIPFNIVMIINRIEKKNVKELYSLKSYHL